MPKKQRLSKRKYIEARIDELLAKRYQNEIAKEYQEMFSTDEAKKQVESAEFNIAQCDKEIKWLETILEKL